MSSAPVSLRSGRLPAGARQTTSAQVGDITFTVGNFKSIASADLMPKRLTLLAGANSSGKSSLLQALLFLAQSFGESTPVLNGDLVQLGEPRDVLRDETTHLLFEFRYRAELDALPGAGGEADIVLRVVLAAVEGRGALVADEFALVIDSQTVLLARETDIHAGPPVNADERLFHIDPNPSLGLSDETYLAAVGLLPRRVIRRADKTALEAAIEASIGMMKDAPMVVAQHYVRMARAVGGHDGLISLLEDAMRKRQRSEAISCLVAIGKEHRDALFAVFTAAEAPDGWVSEPIANAPNRGFPQLFGLEQPGDAARQALVRNLAAARERVGRLARAVTYLGPLRDEPRIAYPLGHTVRALPVGQKGEFTAAYLQDNYRMRLPFVLPDGTEKTDSLAVATSQWSDYLGIAEKVSVESRGKLGHQLGLEVGGRKRDPTMIGVGASQLLPVIVLVLGAPQGSLVLLEQPELHLHPKVQSRLADFFVKARPDIRIVIETHSEYLVTRLRRRVAEGELRPTDVALIFAKLRNDKSDAKSSKSTYTELRYLAINELGDFDDWPEDFFDTLGNDAVELAHVIRERLQPSG